MDYNGINEIFGAGIENMTCLLKDSGNYDGGTLALDGTEFFSFLGNSVMKIYSHGDSYWGFGTDNTHLTVDNRDTRMRSLYREEGTLYGYYKFIKIRWEGWSHYNQSSASYQLKYDLILWDTGDLSLHMVEIPTSCYDGNFQLRTDQNYNYTKPTRVSPDVTFQYSSETKSFEIKYQPIDLVVPFKILIADSAGVLYTIEKQRVQTEEDTTETEGTDKEKEVEEIEVLVPLEETELNSEVFLARGYDRLPEWELIKGLDTPKIYAWSEIKAFPINAEITGTPPKQYIECMADLSDGTVLGIKALNAEYSGEVTEQHSYDGENFTEEIPMADFLTCDKDALYAGLTEEKHITFRFWLKQNATLTTFIMNYRNGDDDDAKS